MPFVIANLTSILAIVFGVLILINPRLLSTLIGIYLIIVGLVGLGILRF